MFIPTITLQQVLVRTTGRTSSRSALCGCDRERYEFDLYSGHDYILFISLIFFEFLSEHIEIKHKTENRLLPLICKAEKIVQQKVFHHF